MCSNRDCIHEFCQYCIKENLGEAILDSVIANDDWFCIVCDPPERLSEISNYKEMIRKKSIFSLSETDFTVDQEDLDEFSSDGVSKEAIATDSSSNR
jgi:hypothetical protein